MNEVNVVKKKKQPVLDIKSTKHEMGEEVDLNTLRKDKILKKKVSSELKKHQLVSENEAGSSESDSSESYFDGSSGEVKESKKKQKHKKKKSAVNAKASDRVRHPQKWPQSHLQFEYVNKQVKFDELDFKLFVA